MYDGEQRENGTDEPDVEAHRLDAIEIGDENEDEDEESEPADE